MSRRTRRSCVAFGRHLTKTLRDQAFEVLDEDAEIRNLTGGSFRFRARSAATKGYESWFRESWEVFTGLHHELEEVIEVGDGATVISVQRVQGRTRHMKLDTDSAVGGGLDVLELERSCMHRGVHG